MVSTVTKSAVEYLIQRTDEEIDKVIIGYVVTRFGVPMIGQYVNAGIAKRVTISLAVPSVQYRITAWALGDGRRSAIPEMKNTATGEARECM